MSVYLGVEDGRPYMLEKERCRKRKDKNEIRGPKLKQTEENRSRRGVKASVAVKRSSGGGYFSAQPWLACQMLTGRETRREKVQPLETWRFTPITYLAWIGPLPHCSISKKTLSLIRETDYGQVVADQGDDNSEVDDDWNSDRNDGEWPGEQMSWQGRGRDILFLTLMFEYLHTKC